MSTAKKKDIGYEILWDLHPDLNTDLAPTIICAFLYLLPTEKWKDIGEVSPMAFYFRKNSVCKISFETLKSQSSLIYHCHNQPDGAVGKPMYHFWDSEIKISIISTISESL